MKTNEKEQQIIPEKYFAEAFCALLKCKSGEFAIKMIAENLSAQIEYQGNIYQVDTYQWLYDDVLDMITNTDHAQHINISIWLQVSEDALSCQDFYFNLVKTLEDPEEATLLNLALSISSFTPDRKETFWYTLWRLDRIGSLFGRAIVAAAKTFNLNVLADEILDLMIANGNTEYNAFVEGVFGSVQVPINSDDELTFYIYSVMP
jgi:hypothetical protein